MRRIILLLILALLLGGCAEAEPENPYRLKTQTTVNYYDAEETEHSVTYFYDDEGRISHYEASNGDITRHSYDEYGNHIGSETKGPDGTDVTTEYVLTLDDQHRPVRSEFYWNGEHKSTSVYTYDKIGNVVQLDIDWISPDGNEQSCVTREYDRKGNLLREETAWSNGESGCSLYEYKDAHLVYLADYTGEDVLQRYSAITWDEAARTALQKNYRANGEVDGHFISYYDEFGNCLKRKYYNGPRDAIGGGDDVLDRMVTYTYELIPE